MVCGFFFAFFRHSCPFPSIKIRCINGTLVDPGLTTQEAHLLFPVLQLVIHRLELGVVHEMVHLLERHHNDRFRGFLDRFLPTWRLSRDVLKGEPLGHEDWVY